MKCNLNDYVKVKLTNTGKEIHEERHYELLGRLIDKYPYEDPKVDEEGYSKFQLWELMNIFGKYCYNGCKVPFETNIIIEDYNGGM